MEFNIKLRKKLKELLMQEKNIREISEILQVHISTVYRELQKNNIKSGNFKEYDPLLAQELAEKLKQKRINSALLGIAKRANRNRKEKELAQKEFVEIYGDSKY